MADLDEAPPPRRSKRAKLNDDELIEPPAEAATEATTTAAVPNSEPLDQDQPASSTNAVAEETAVDKPPRRRSAPTRVSWEDRMAMLVEYKKEHGNLLIPIRYRSNPSLGKFVHNTREQYKLFHKRTPAGYKKKCSLTQERIDELDAIGFVWTTERSKRQHEDWEGRLEQLLAYKEQHGDCMVPHGYEADPSFAEWIHRQRTTYATHVKEGRKNPMVEERMKKLDGIGFNFVRDCIDHMVSTVLVSQPLTSWHLLHAARSRRQVDRSLRTAQGLSRKEGRLQCSHALLWYVL